MNACECAPLRWSGGKARARRVAAGLPLEAVAIRAGRSAASIQSYELGRVTPGLPVALAIAETLGVDVRDLMEPAETGASAGAR